MTVTVGTGGTYKGEPAAGTVLPRQLLAPKISAVVLYRSAMVYNVSFALTMIWSQPDGGLHTTGAANVALGMAVEVSVGRISNVFVGAKTGVETGCSSEVAMTITGMEVGVACCERFSASESEIPPMTSKSEMMAIKTPPPI